MFPPSPTPPHLCAITASARNGHNAPATKPLMRDLTPRRRSDVPTLPHRIYAQWPQCTSSDQALMRDVAACYPGVVVSSPASVLRSLIDGVPTQATQAMHATTAGLSRPPHPHNPPPFAHVSCPPALPPSTNTSHQHLSPAILTSLPSLCADLANAPICDARRGQDRPHVPRSYAPPAEPPYARTDDEKDEFAHPTASGNNVVRRRKTLSFGPVLPHSIYRREPLATRCVPASSVSLPTHTTWHSASLRTSSLILLRPASFVIRKDSSVKARLTFVQVPQGESTA
ncbi:uncharacterized protein LAESUDRAFT_759224 [Laetiporus sulphureus 93-53]|uniref:Uncharacterized protein n=1 Tax=Laetiporus sulphureus 93-53 TaxID=1314785 RepID=A0A165ECK6_9APHY|nr:uncharacterized protein LAESUDRAFT_759224 [Laetiporus sulphureus 93-53]KZT06732.1 hypothetical protein LAESUDRAFT_759224 [Laetiporus sulphureus 93-53]